MRARRVQFAGVDGIARTDPGRADGRIAPRARTSAERSSSGLWYRFSGFFSRHFWMISFTAVRDRRPRSAVPSAGGAEWTCW